MLKISLGNYFCKTHPREMEFRKSTNRKSASALNKRAPKECFNSYQALRGVKHLQLWRPPESASHLLSADPSVRLVAKYSDPYKPPRCFWLPATTRFQSSARPEWLLTILETPAPEILWTRHFLDASAPLTSYPSQNRCIRSHSAQCSSPAAVV